jgi:LacI family transcriptional regulator
MTASIRDVAAAAGVSLGTVSNVINGRGRVAPTTIVRVHAAIDELGFVRNDAARQLRAGRSRSIGLVVLEATNPFFADVARGADDRARADGYVVLLADSDDDRDREQSNLDLFEEQRVAGVVLSPVSDDTARIGRLRQRGIEVVLLEWAGAVADVPSVSVDNTAGGRMAVGHLAACARRHVAFVGGPFGLQQVAERARGAALAASENRVELTQVVTAELTIPAGRAAGVEIAAMDPRSRPDAVFAANDLLAIGVLQGIRSCGLDVPGDIALVGYDDIDYASVAEVPLTSIRQPSRTLGATAVELLLERTSDPTTPARHLVFQPDLVVRSSTGTPAA